MPKKKTTTIILLVLAVIPILLIAFILTGKLLMSISHGAVRVDASISDDGSTIGLGFSHSRSNDWIVNSPNCISVSGNVIHSIVSCDMSREKWAQGIIDGNRTCGFVPEKDKDWYCISSYEHKCFEYGGYTFAGDCVDGSIKNYCVDFYNNQCSELGLGYDSGKNLCKTSFDIIKLYEISEESYFKVNGYDLHSLTFDGSEVCAVSDFEILRPLSMEINFKFVKPQLCEDVIGYKIVDNKCVDDVGCEVAYLTLEDCKNNLEKSWLENYWWVILSVTISIMFLIILLIYSLTKK